MKAELELLFKMLSALMLQIFAPQKFGGGGGNRTPVRRYSAKSDYMLSRCFVLILQAPNGGVLKDQPV